MRLQLEEWMAYLQDQTDENSRVTVAHLENLINQGGVDRVASAFNGLILDLSDNMVGVT